MKTFDEFEISLVRFENVHVCNGNILVKFYPALYSEKCGLVTACVEFCVSLPDGTYHSSSSVCSSMEAYEVYESLISKTH